MSDPIKTGGPAFPVKVRHVDKYLNREGDKVVAFGEFPTEYETGMTLRDWFAGQSILPATYIAEKCHEGDVSAKDVAAKAYEIADAMLQQQEVQP